MNNVKTKKLTITLLSICLLLAIAVSMVVFGGINSQVALAAGSGYNLTLTEPAAGNKPSAATSTVAEATVDETRWYVQETNGSWTEIMDETTQFLDGNVYKVEVVLSLGSFNASGDGVYFNDKKANLVSSNGNKYTFSYTYSLKNVAQIGTRKYTTLDAAIADAVNGDEIELLDDITLSGTYELSEEKTIVIPSGKTLTLASTGYKTSGNLTISDFSQILVKEGGNLVLEKDSSTDGYPAILKLNGSCGLDIYGTFTVNSGYVYANTQDFSDISIRPTGNIIIRNGARYYLKYSSYYPIEYVGTSNAAIILGENSELSERLVDGSKFEYTLKGSAKLKNAKFGETPIPLEIPSSMIIKISDKAKATVENMTLNGGSFTVEKGGELAVADGGTLTLTTSKLVIADGAKMTRGTGTVTVPTDWEISSGTFDFNPANDDPSIIVKENYNVYQYSTSKYVVLASDPAVETGYDFWQLDTTLDPAITTKVYKQVVCTHTGLQHVEAKAATETAEGNIEYWYCEACGKYFSNATATTTIKKENTTVPKSTSGSGSGSGSGSSTNGSSTAGGSTNGSTAGSGTTGDTTSGTTNSGTISGTDTDKGNQGLQAGAVVGIVFGILIFLLLLAYVLGYFFLYRKHKLDDKAIKVIYSFLPQDRKEEDEKVEKAEEKQEENTEEKQD